MSKKIFEPIPCGQTLPINNIHAVSVSMPTMTDVIGYENHEEKIVEKIKSGYPRFILHPYLKILASYITKKYSVSDEYEVVLLSSKKSC
jgi:cystathionine gamma-synthase